MAEWKRASSEAKLEVIGREVEVTKKMEVVRTEDDVKVDAVGIINVGRFCFGR